MREKKVVLSQQDAGLLKEGGQEGPFIQNLRRALLLSLLEQKKLTPLQFDLCEKKLRRYG